MLSSPYLELGHMGGRKSSLISRYIPCMTGGGELTPLLTFRRRYTEVMKFRTMLQDHCALT